MTPMLRICHKLTLYHWRHNRRGITIIGLCECGYKARFLARIDRAQRWRMLTRFCWLRGHALGERNEVYTGPIDFEESEDTFFYAYRQCERCYSCIEADD